MENRVGTVVPTDAEVAKLAGDIESIIARSRKWSVQLTPEQRRAITKFRPGGEEVVATVGGLVDKYKVSLPGISHEDMDADLRLARVLAPLASAATQLAQLVDDTVLEAEGECWWAATAFYSSLARIAPTTPALGESLKPVVQFFAQGRRQKPPAAK